MKLIIEKNVLVNNLEKVSRAISTRNIIPVLNGVKFELSKNGLTLVASDNEISIEVFIDKKDIKSIDEEGAIVVSNGLKLLELLKRVNKKDIYIQCFEENEVIFKSDKFEYKSSCFNKNDYPNITFEENDSKIELDSTKFKDIISKTSFACSLQESRPLLTGVNIKVVGDIFECVATDSYRLSKVQIMLNNPSDNNYNIVIPARNVNELCKILQLDNSVSLNIFNNKILFKQENIKFQSSLLNGTYPNTDNSIPTEFNNRVKVNLKNIYDLVNNAALISQTKDKNIIDMEINNNILTIKSNSQEGKFEDSIEIENLSNNDIKISFSAKYMSDALKIYNCDNILLLMNGEISPIILNEEDNKELIQLILPMKTY